MSSANRINQKEAPFLIWNGYITNAGARSKMEESQNTLNQGGGSVGG
ncbi:MAG: hypothetical protein HQL52_14740 [Magnetococcales bacterium]|nr:hypothetical protein [Magnetococcales bacterium]